MTEKELNQLHWINKEIGVLKKQKDELEYLRFWTTLISNHCSEIKGQKHTG